MTTYQPAPYSVYVPRTNGLGVAGFVCSLIGLIFTGGLLCPIGLILSLVALGRQPRGFAIAGVILGFLGTCGGLIAIVFFGAAILALMGLAAGAILLAALADPVKAEVTYDMAVIASGLEKYEAENRYLPADLSSLGVDPANLTDPWGNPYKYSLTDAEPGYELESDGADGQPATVDDIAFSRLGDLWSTEGNVQVTATGDDESGKIQLKIGDQVIDISGDDQGGRIEVKTEGRTILLDEKGMHFDQNQGQDIGEQRDDDADDSGTDAGDEEETGDGSG